MREYSVTLISVCALCCTVGILLRGKRCEKYARCAMGLLLLYALISPLPKLIENVAFDIKDFDVPSYSDAFGDALEESIARGIEEALAEEFELDGELLRVELSGLTREPLGAERIYVILSGGAVTADHRRIKAFVEKMGLGECEVRLDFG